MQPVFLGLAEVLEIHRDQVERYGGEPGIRDLDLLQSALGMPAAGFGGDYLHRNLFEMAAAYLFHLARNHPFLDANKRTALVATLVFLSLNNIEIEAGEDTLEETVLATAEGRLGKARIAAILQENARKPNLDPGADPQNA